MTPHEMYSHLFIATFSRLAARDLTPLTENRKHAIQNLADLASDVAQGGVDLHLNAAKEQQEADEADETCECEECQEETEGEGEYFTNEEVFDRVVKGMSSEQLAEAAAKILKRVSNEATGKEGSVRIHIVQTEN